MKHIALIFCLACFTLSAATEADFAAKYGPASAGLSSEQTAKILSAITWETNDQYSILGSKEAKKGGTLVYSQTSYPPTLRTEGKNSNTVFNSLVSGLVYEVPLGLDPITSKYVPGLADKWCIGPDRKTYYLHFDERARWVDGKPVTAYDYVATWNFLTNPGLDDPFTVEYWNKFERPVALSAQVLMIKSKELEWRMFLSAAAGISILPAHVLYDLTAQQYLTEYEQKMLPGSGPYEFESCKTNEYIIMKRNPDWWGKDLEMNRGTNNFDRLRFAFVSDESLKIEMFKKGDLDFHYCRVARRWHQEFTADKVPAIAGNWIVRRRIYSDSPNGLSGIAFNLRQEPFSDIRVRKAFSMLYNREKFMDKLFYNEYAYMDSFFPNSPYENPGNPKLRFSPDEAVLLLDEAGWSQSSLNSDGFLVKDGKVFEVDLNTIGEDDRVETILKEDLADVGIKLNLKKVTWATEIKERGERNFKITEASYSGSRFPNPESMFHSKYADRNNTGNIYGFKNKRADEICEQYNVEFDLETRIKLLQELDSILMKEHIYALGWFSNNTRLLYWNKFGMPEFVLSRYDSASFYTIINYWWYDEEKDRKLEQAKKSNSALPKEAEEVKYWQQYKKSYEIGK
ncbi:MAG: ABC transporter substrate-binding protein [Candidatus Wallbacteria bacterium]|nr:ABC transporter substrate-binding protein [Candidatus Wallbacteria bacterium]